MFRIFRGYFWIEKVLQDVDETVMSIKWLHRPCDIWSQAAERHKRKSSEARTIACERLSMFGLWVTILYSVMKFVNIQFCQDDTWKLQIINIQCWFRSYIAFILQGLCHKQKARSIIWKHDVYITTDEHQHSTAGSETPVYTPYLKIIITLMEQNLALTDTLKKSVVEIEVKSSKITLKLLKYVDAYHGSSSSQTTL